MELGEDGTAEIVDYKSREALAFNSEKVQNYKSRENLEKEISFDMDLMPKIYTLLCSENLLKKGYKKARFKVRIWQDPLQESFFEEFDLTAMNGAEFLFKQKIANILKTREIKFCEKSFCKACKSPKRDEYLSKLKSLGLNV
ncbi:hypothetical protein HY025_00650 [Candidatus Daviesbacteria bacterium]|nr:hypothetical protein [Candidatus Daviesbacteria bacterium]